MEVIFPESIDISLLILKLGEQFASYPLRNCRIKLRILQKKKTYGRVHKNHDQEAMVVTVPCDLIFSSACLIKIKSYIVL